MLPAAPWNSQSGEEESQGGGTQLWVLGKKRSGHRWDYRPWVWIWFRGSGSPPEEEEGRPRPVDTRLLGGGGECPGEEQPCKGPAVRRREARRHHSLHGLGVGFCFYPDVSTLSPGSAQCRSVSLAHSGTMRVLNGTLDPSLSSGLRSLRGRTLGPRLSLTRFHTTPAFVV